MKVKEELFSIKRLLLVSFFFNICCNALSSSSSESTLISKVGDYKHLAKDYKQLIKNGHGSKVMMRSNEVDENRSKALKGLHEVINFRSKVSSIGINNQSKKANKGGVYGGGDLVRPRNQKGGASSISLKSSSSMAIKTLALGLLFFFFF